MRISLIVPAPFDLVSGGYGYDRRIVERLRSSGHDVDVVALDGAFPMVDEAGRSAARTAWMGLAHDAIPVIDGLALPGFAGMEAVLAARNAVGLIHHPLSLETGLNDADRVWLDAAERASFRHLTRFITTSEATANTLAAGFGVAAARITVIVPGTDDAARCMGSRGGLGGGSCEILSIGTLIPRKGHDVLLRALARLFDLDWRLTIVGSPDRDVACARELVTLARDLAIGDRVHFAGELVGEALDAAWRRADLFALATRYEGYGMVIAEALKRGLPVVVTKGGAAGALVTPETGCACPVDDSDQVSKSLRRLIFGVDLRRDLADAAWRSGQNLPSWSVQAALFAESLG